VVRGPAFRKIISFLAVLTAVGNILDGITTRIGLSLGGTERVPVAIEIMKSVGVDGFVLLKFGMGLFFLVAGLSYARRWHKTDPRLCLIVLVLMSFACFEFGFPVVANLYQISRMV